ncbi:hypothetical protein HHK36_009423 [Tetracentron sinense]|uniref:Uncharacterized protein n=1 Tax=Tetracentron sinense TaxID=13715 RepID=A0A835DIE3_TETSI|nr:hypothetical protein HHK36_009423 [Tetracentron sinense]
MSSVGVCLAEVYVARKLYKEKLKRMEEEGGRKEESDPGEKKPGRGIFGRTKKIHPSSSTSSNCAGKQSETLNSKGTFCVLEMEVGSSSNVSAAARVMGSKKVFPHGIEIEVMRIETAALSVMGYDEEHSWADVIRTGEFIIRVIKQSISPILITLCMVCELQWPVTRDSPILRVGSRSFAFAIPGLFYGLQFPNNSCEKVLRTLERLFMRLGHYENHSGRENGIPFSVPENEPYFWSVSQWKMEEITNPLLSRIGAQPRRSSPTSINVMNDLLMKVLRMSAVTKLITKAVLVGGLDSNHIDIFHTMPSSPPCTNHNFVSPRAFATIFVFSDMVEAVEATRLIVSGNCRSLEPCHPTWTPLPGIKIWNINKKGLKLLLQPLVSSASAYHEQMLGTTEKSKMKKKMSWETMETDWRTCDPMEEESMRGEEEAEEASPIREILFPIIVAAAAGITVCDSKNPVEKMREGCVSMEVV